MKKKPARLPRGYRSCTSSLAVCDVSAALRFYEDAFGAVIQGYDCEEAPGFAVIKIGNSMLFVTAGWGVHGPSVPGAAIAVGHHMYVEDADAALTAALDNGATLLASAADTYWGERCATVADPFGHIWTFATRVENLKSEDIGERRKALLGAIQDQGGASVVETAMPAEEAAAV